MILGQLGSKLAQKDLEGTADWVESMPYKASEQVMSNLLSRWTVKTHRKQQSGQVKFKILKKGPRQ